MLLRQVPAAIRGASFNLGLVPGFARARPARVPVSELHGLGLEPTGSTYFDKICHDDY